MHFDMSEAPVYVRNTRLMTKV